MAKEVPSDLEKFLQPFPKEVQANALHLRAFVRALYPLSNELIYDAPNALAFGWSTTDRLGDTFCSVAVYSKYVHFGFYRGCDITDPEQRLSGNGNQYRYLIVRDQKEFPKTYIKRLVKEAYANSLARLAIANKKPALEGHIITKSVAAKKRRPS